MDLKVLAEMMIQLEHAHFRTPADPPPTPPQVVSMGPDVVTETVPLDPVTKKNDPKKLLDTAYGDPEPGDENPAIPAGYTYLGQFIDHDITFDPASSLQKINDPDATEDFRTPRLDLDSLYGRGPDDQPYLYQDDRGIKLLMGRKINFNPADDADLHDIDRRVLRRGDLPRNVEGRALTGDPRNDENNIICQIQALFINFHNKVVDTLDAARPLLSDQELFLEAQRIVRWTYQYIVMNDYLPKVVGEETWLKIYGGLSNKEIEKFVKEKLELKHPKPTFEFYKPHEIAYMPVEFSVAAFRFGHSQVRPSYALRAGNENAVVGGGDKKNHFINDPRYHRVPIFSDVSFNPNLPEAKKRRMSLDGFGPLFPFWEIDWRLFFSEGNMPTFVGEKGIFGVQQDDEMLTQPGYRIDTKLVDPLAMLPPNVAKSGNMPDHIPSLAFRNLLRGSSFELPSGQDVARALDLEPLTEAQLWAGFPEDAFPAATGKSFHDSRHNPFAFRAPLWFYILREAELEKRPDLKDDALGGHHLGPVGGRIVAEVLVGLAYNDHHSFLYQDSTWTPTVEAAKSGFDPKHDLTTMFNLIHWVTDGKMGFEPT